MTDSRLNRLYTLMQTAKIPALALNPGPTLSYLTGLTFHLMERPVVLLLAPPAEPALVLPELETAKLNSSHIVVQAFTYNDNPASWSESFKRAAQQIGVSPQTIGVEPNKLRFLELRFLQVALPETHFISAENILSQLRMQKDEQELALMRQAVHIAQDALTATLPYIKIGVAERDIATELSLQMLRAGSDPENPFSPIVSSGPNSANPHASPSARKLQPGDLLVIDWGAYYQGYCSDLTRTLAIGKIHAELENIYRIVAAANATGRAVGKPGLPAGGVDYAARAVIEAAGYGPYFFHRTGHGLGMEGHEPPYMYAENTLALAPGMTYTVEPGIYLPDRGGVRIEDDVVVTAAGSESLSDFTREMITVE